MEMKRSSFLLINLAVLAVLILAAVVVGGLVLKVQLHTDDVEAEARFSRIMTSAELYYRRIGYYEGVCADVGVPSRFNCSDEEMAFAVETKLDSGEYLCGDSSGFSGLMPNSKGNSSKCR